MNEFHVIEGFVFENDDPQQMGRVKAWCPAVDGPIPEGVDLRASPAGACIPWSSYVSPLAGQTVNYPGGAGGQPTAGHLSYGFWAIPKVGAVVLVAVLYGDVNCRYFIGSVFGDQDNRSLPTGRNRAEYASAPVSDTFDPVEPQTTNLNLQFGGNLNAPEARTRGAYERAVAQDQDVRNGTEGYQLGAAGGGRLDPQTYCLTTPGRHTLLFQDHPTTSRTRLKTADGHQIILDDANERIYVSTAQGNTWIELDSDGHVHLYGASSVSVGSGADLNFTANGSLNVKVGGDINLSAGGHGRLSACGGVAVSGKTINIESGGTFDVLAVAAVTLSGTVINLNGPPAKPAPCAGAPAVVPDHEPWTRPDGVAKRNKNWKK